MRSSVLVLAAGIVAVGVACASATLVAQEPPREVPANRADLDRDLEVMRRLLAREGLGAGTPVSLRSGETKYVYVSPAGDRAAEAFHVRGDGALFLLRTSDAVAPPPGSPREDAAPKSEPTAWDRIADEVEGRPGGAGVHDFLRRGALPRLSDRYDAAKVDALRDRILDQLGKYGDRIRGLDPGAHLTVVVTGGGSQRFAAASALDALVAQADGTTLAVQPQVAVASLPDRSVLTIRVALADCRRSAKGEIDLVEFRRRAIVAQY